MASGAVTGAGTLPVRVPRTERCPAERSRRSRLRRDQEGASLVEAALVIPVLLLLLFGIIDWGNIFNDYLAVRQGARDGARQAAVSTAPTPPGGGAWGCPSTGITQSGDGYSLVCFTKDRVGLDQTKTRVSVEFTPQSQAPKYAPGQGVVICAQYPATSLSGFFKPFVNGIILTTKVEIRIEQPSSTFTSGVQETPLTPTWPASCNTP
jgi:hypothetical protein